MTNFVDNLKNMFNHEVILIVSILIIYYQDDGVPCGRDDDVGAGDNAGACLFQRRLDLVDQLVSSHASVSASLLLASRPVQQY